MFRERARIRYLPKRGLRRDLTLCSSWSQTVRFYTAGLGKHIGAKSPRYVLCCTCIFPSASFACFGRFGGAPAEVDLTVELEISMAEHSAAYADFSGGEHTTGIFQRDFGD